MKGKLTMAKKSKVGAVADSVSVEKVASYVDEVVADHNKVVEAENINAETTVEESSDSAAQSSYYCSVDELENNTVANAIDSIFSEPYFDPRGECEWIHPMLKLSYSICPSTPTVEMQKAAIKRLTETMENDMEAEYGHNLKTSFELKHAILGKDTVTFIGEIQKLHDPLPEIQFLLKEGWEHASQEAGVKSKSECKGMEIILN